MVDHSLPLLFLLVDFYFNAVPFCWRHLVFVWCMIDLYLLENIIVVYSSGKATYPILTWRNVISWFSFIIFPVILSIIFAIFKLIADLKLKKNGYGDAVMVMKDELHILKNNNISDLERQKDTFGVYNHFKDSNLHANGPKHLREYQNDL